MCENNKQPVCETCGDTKQVAREVNDYGKPHGIDKRRYLEIQTKYIPCPTCKPVPDNKGVMAISLTHDRTALVDAEDYERLNKHNWATRITKWGCYAGRDVSKGGKKTILMHREILNVPKGQQVDHINHDGLDNRKCNLRICTNSQNQHNQRPRVSGSSKYKGVSWRKDVQKWYARIKHNGKLVHLGGYDNEDDAARVYNEKATEYYGEYACLNDIEGITNSDFTRGIRNKLLDVALYCEGVDAMAKPFQDLKEACSRLDQSNEQVRGLRLETKRLREEIRQLKGHDRFCASRQPSTDPAKLNDCTCGFEQALQESENE